MNLEHAERKRDLRLRRRVLLLLHAARIRPDQGWLTGRFVMDLVSDASPSGQSFTDDHHAAALLRDLINGGYVEERDDRLKQHQPATLDFTSYRITHKGTALVEQQIEPDPLVDDDRLPRTARRS